VRRIAVLDAPSNLGLRPPTETSVPGCAKAPGALRDHGLLTRLGARDAGCLTPPRYDPGDWRPGDGVAHAAQIAAYSRSLADRIGVLLDAGEFPVILGGDCSILLGSGIAMHRLGEAVGGRIGLVFVDGHSDFRHPGNASYVGAAAGEDLALVTGRGQADLTAIESRRPYFRDIDVVVLGMRAQDEYRLDLQAAGIVTRPVPALRAEGAARSAQWARDQLVDCAGYWVHVDVDVLDPAVMPAVDAPSPGGIAFPELELLLAGLVESPHCLGVEITVFDPDYDPDGLYAAEISSTIAAGLAAARTVNARPDLTAVRADLATAQEHGHDQRRPEDFAFTPAAGPAVAPAAGPAVAPAAGPAVAPPAGPAVAPPAGPAVAPAAEAPVVLDHPAGSSGSGLRKSDEGATDSPVAVASESADPGPLDLAETEAQATSRQAGGLATDAAVTGTGDRVTSSGPVLESDPAVDAIRADHDAPDNLLVPRSSRDIDTPANPDGRVGTDTVSATHPKPAAAVAESTGVRAEPGSVGFELGGWRAESVGLGAEPVAAVLAEPRTEGGVRLLPRPLGQAPMLDSEPLPATRPGMLRPRTVDESSYGGFSLPTQRPALDNGTDERPALDNGTDEPADIA
jgi:arginase